jgi:hypothetical protein
VNIEMNFKEIDCEVWRWIFMTKGFCRLVGSITRGLVKCWKPYVDAEVTIEEPRKDYCLLSLLHMLSLPALSLTFPLTLPKK